MENALHVIILAAGEGKRMRSALPKVLLPIAGKSMLGHVVDAARQLDASAIHIVFGHRGEQVRAAFADQPDLQWVHQPEQRGTGHAVQLALANVPDGARVLVLYGDVPLIRAATLQPLRDTTSALAVLAAELADPHGYGRIVLRRRPRRRDRRGQGLRRRSARDQDRQHRHRRRGCVERCARWVGGVESQQRAGRAVSDRCFRAGCRGEHGGDRGAVR